ncbi:MAG: hypothetical protein ABS76_13070 [Pelagibacterium sp. SCN 64-44]|nr:MAG: hypothetical protein ABS76_13070 [Pelagibacterium sp. SCN 64-44]
MATAINVSRSTAFTLLQTLTNRGLVMDSRIGGARLYHLGLALVRLGDQAASELKVTQVASPILQALTETTHLTSRLAISDEGYAVTIVRNDGPGIQLVNASLGRRELPHCSAIGKSLLSQLSDDEVVGILNRLGMPRRTDNTLTTAAELLADLKLTRQRGYSIDNEEDHLGVVCLGAPVFGRDGQVIAAISVSTIKSANPTEQIENLGRTVKVHADLLSSKIGRQE